MNTNPVSYDGEALEDMETFTHLDGIIDERGGSDEDMVKQGQHFYN